MGCKCNGTGIILAKERKGFGYQTVFGCDSCERSEWDKNKNYVKWGSRIWHSEKYELIQYNPLECNATNPVRKGSVPKPDVPKEHSDGLSNIFSEDSPL